MDNKNLIDDLFRSKLEGYNPEYVPEHWQMMKSALETTSKKGIRISRISTSNVLLILSAVIIVFTGIYTYKLSEKLRNQYNKIENNTYAQNINHEQSSLNNHTRITTDILKDNSQNIQNNNNYQINFQNLNHGKPINKTESKNTSSRNGLYQNSLKYFKLKDASVVANSLVVDSFQSSIKPKTGNVNNLENKTDINIFANSTLLSNSTSETNNHQNENITDISKKDQGYSESDMGLIAIDDNPNYSSVTDDYLVKKQSVSEKRFKQIERNASAQMDVKKEVAPDYKVSVVNNIISNPAFAGFNQHHTIVLSTIVHKPTYKPASDFTVPFEYGISYDFNFGRKNNYGLGLNYKRFVGGAEGSLDIDLTFAYRFRFAKGHNLRLGVAASYVSSGINFDDLTFPDMIDQNNGYVYNTSEISPSKTISYNFDFSLGLWYSWKSYYLGISALHLANPNIGIISESRIPREYTLSSGYSFKLSKSIDVLPAFELKYHGRLMNFSPNLLFAYKRWLLFGLEFQNLKNAGIVIGCNFKNNFILNFHGGIPMNKNIIDNFGIIDYTGLSLRFQFGNSH
ncbi:MAG: PorP/SprF family type IX secretion system membrane protein [Bacteroidota bacterium]